MLLYLKYLFGKVRKYVIFTFLLVGTLFTILNVFFYLTQTKIPIPDDHVSAAQAGRNKVDELLSKTANSDDPAIQLEHELTASIICGTTGEACGDDISQEEAFNQSLMGGATNLIVAPFKQLPASGIEYVAYKLDNNDFLPQAYAYEGIGLASVKQYIPLWEMFRNFSYLILVIIIVVIGFMIMFRMQLNPQTVVSLENALPRIITSLILITFSFAIVGFLIDLLYGSIAVFTYLITSEISNVPAYQSIFSKDPTEYVNQYLTSGFWGIYPHGGLGNAFSAGRALFGILPLSIQVSISTILGPILAGLMAEWFSKPIGWVTNSLSNLGVGAEGSFLGIGGGFQATWGKLPTLVQTLILLILKTFFAWVVIPLIMGLLVIFTLIFFIFRIFFMLLFHYIKLLLLLIFAPILLIFHAIPGTNVFGWWIRSVISQLITFPLFAIFALIGTAIIEINQLASGADFRLPFLYDIPSDKFGILLGMGLIFIIPDLIRLIKSLLGLPEMNINVGLGTYFGGAGAALGGFQQAQQTFSPLASFSTFKGLRNSKVGQQLAPRTTTESIDQLSKLMKKQMGISDDDE